jgi:lipopolysaccharide heptosyltransferase I
MDGLARAVRDPRSILVIKMSALGDIIHALPTLHALRTLYPAASINWVVEPRFAELLPGPPWIDALIPFDKAALRGRRVLKGLAALRGSLKAAAPELVIDLQGLLKSSLVAVLSGCRHRLGYCEMREGSGLFARAVKGPNAKGHVIERYRDVVRSLGPIPDELVFPLPDHARESAEARARLDALGVKGRPVVVFPGAGWSSKLWPPSSLAALSRGLADRGFEVVLGGAEPDLAVVRRVLELAGPQGLKSLVGATTIRGLMGLVGQAALCVGADTGPLHLAAAVGTPTVTLFGPSCHKRAGTLGPAARNVATTAWCSPCFKRSCPRTFVCMGLIEPETVLEASLAALAGAPSDPGAGLAPVEPVEPVVDLV